MKGTRTNKKLTGQKKAYDRFTRLRSNGKLLDFICAINISGYGADVLQGRALVDGVEQFKLTPAELNEYAARTARLSEDTHCFVPCYQKQ